jgi:D-threo-aldose 1-dehydrogenase
VDPLERRHIGRTDLEVTALGFGGATLGDIREPISEEQADATLQAALDAGIGYFDTAPWYGLGKSEHRFGHVLRNAPRERFTLSTKVGRVLFAATAPGARHPAWPHGLPFGLRFDYTRAGVLRSCEDSLQRLGMARVDALLIHDLDFGYHGSEAGVAARFAELDSGGGFAALVELKARGEIAAIGAGINATGLIPRFLERFDLDFFLVAMPYTLLNQDGLAELDECHRRGVSVVIGAPFASGILALGAGPRATYGYRPPDDEVRERAARIGAVCSRHGVPAGAAALQFVLAHPAVASVIPGPNTPEQVRANVEWVRWPIPPALWDELKAEGLLRAAAPVPG